MHGTCVLQCTVKNCFIFISENCFSDKVLNPNMTYPWIKHNKILQKIILWYYCKMVFVEHVWKIWITIKITAIGISLLTPSHDLHKFIHNEVWYLEQGILTVCFISQFSFLESNNICVVLYSKGHLKFKSTVINM